MESSFNLESTSPDICMNLPTSYPFTLIQKLLRELKETRKDLALTKSVLAKVVSDAKTTETLQNQHSSEIFLLKAGFQSFLEERKKLENNYESHSQRLSSLTEAVKKNEFQLKQTKTLLDDTLSDFETLKEEFHIQSCVLEDTQVEITKTRSELFDANAAVRRITSAHENTRNLLSENCALLLESREEFNRYKSELKSQLQKNQDQAKFSKTWSEDLSVVKNDLQEIQSAVTLSRISQTNSRKMLLEQSSSLKEISLEVFDAKTKIELISKQLKAQSLEFQSFKQEIEAKAQTNSDLVHASRALVEDLRSDLYEQKNRLSRTKSECSHQWSAIQEQIQDSRNYSEDIQSLKEGIEKINSIIRISTDEFLKTKWSLTDVVTSLKIDTGNQLYQAERDLLDLKGHWSMLKANPIPPGFLYTQFAGQLEPRKLWPSVAWQDVTSEYAGLFFRALGGSSRTFGKVQPEGMPRIGTISFGATEGKTPPSTLVHIPQVTGASQTLVAPPTSPAGGSAQGSKSGYQFHVEGSEVRPRNQAIKIWRRC